jgi:chaperonin GroES
MAKIRPLGDRVLVRPLEKEEITKGGILLPESAKEKPQEGEIVAVGSGKWVEGKLVPLDVKVGDKVIYSKYGGDELKIDGVEHKIMREDDILAVSAA